MVRTIDIEIKKKYELAYFVRNFKVKIRDAYEWGLGDEDLALIIQAWKMKADNLGPEGATRWKKCEEQIKYWHHEFRTKKNINWALPRKEREIANVGLVIEQGERF